MIRPDIVRLAIVESTNSEARRLAAAGAAEGTVVVADQQTAGRGRDGRIWASPPGNLYCSTILRPNLPPARSAELAFLAAVALGESLDELVPMNTRIGFKWPNDVLVEGRKVAGMLLESDGAAIVLGLGVNCASHPAGTEFPATDLAAVIGVAPRPMAVLDGFLGALALWYDRWMRDGFAVIRQAWRGRAEGMGGAIRVRTARETWTGRFLDLDDHGVLLLETTEGLKRIAAGDVFFGRA